MLHSHGITSSVIVVIVSYQKLDIELPLKSYLQKNLNTFLNNFDKVWQGHKL